MEDSIPTPNRHLESRIVTSTFVGLIISAAVIFVIVAGRAAFALILVSAFIAAALHHGVDWLQRRGIKRGIAIALMLLATLGGTGALLTAFLPSAVEQGQEMVERLPTILEAAERNPTFRKLDQQFELRDRIRRAGREVPAELQKSPTPAIRAVTGLFSALADFLAVLFLTVFMLIFGSGLLRAWLRETLPIHRVRYQRVMRRIYKSVGGYLSGIGLVCMVNAIFATILLAILRIPFFLPLGILSGCASLVPYVGPIVMGILISLFALTTGGLWKAVVMAAFYAVYGQVEGHILTPLIFRRTVQVNPLVTIISLVVMATIAGVKGAILAVPLAAAGQVILREWFTLRRERLHLPLTGKAGSVDELPPSELKKLAAEEEAHRRADQSSG